MKTNKWLFNFIFLLDILVLFPFSLSIWVLSWFFGVVCLFYDPPYTRLNNGLLCWLSLRVVRFSTLRKRRKVWGTKCRDDFSIHTFLNRRDWQLMGMRTEKEMRKVRIRTRRIDIHTGILKYLLTETFYV